jgi:hypothetical protein
VLNVEILSSCGVYIKLLSVNLNKRDDYEDQNLDGRIILKYILNKESFRIFHPSGCTGKEKSRDRVLCWLLCTRKLIFDVQKDEQFLDYLEILKMNFVPWSY